MHINNTGALKIFGIDTENSASNICTTDLGRRALSVISENILHSGSAEAIYMTTGLGISSNLEIPFRAPAVIIPALQIIEKFIQIGIEPPKYIIYQALDFIIETNDLDSHTAHIASSRLKDYLTAYIQEFHPKVLDHVQFEFSGKEKNLANSANPLIAVIQHLEREEDALVLNIMEKLKQYRIYNNKGVGTEYIYAAVNIFLNGANPESYPYLDNDPSKHTIIPIGGKKEKPFFELTEHVSSILNPMGSQKTSLLHSLGSQPAYYPHKDGEPKNMEDFSSLNKFHSHIKKDVNAIKVDINGRLDRLLAIHATIHK